ncbi:MAG: methyltransferase domain-containing protein [Lachnospiraceae bacterium]|nr:methyltransferase domain-containing protein [Lachnospiraceae bacterium]
MKCVAIQSFVEGVELYSLVYEPDTLPEDFKSEEVIKRYKAVVAKDKDVWDKFAPIYKFFINASLSNRKAYSAIYGRIRKVAINKEVLELATGPGMIAKEVADVTRSMIATDFSEKMLEQARRGMNPPNLVFEQADASNLRYGDSSFDVVIISNALHIIPDSGKVLEEIKRVLRPGGILIAPNFIHNNDDKLSKLSSNVLKKSGITFEVEWDEEGYKKFLEDNGFKVVNSHVFPSTIPLMYTECKKKE